MRTRTALFIGLLILGAAFLPGCGYQTPKEGVRIQPGDYQHEPGWRPGGLAGQVSHTASGTVAQGGAPAGN